MTFTPSEPKYYSDSFRVACGRQSLSVPLHAFPVVGSKHPFPLRLDLGTCALGRPVTRTVMLENSGPATFEYRLTLIDDAEGQIALSPLQGSLPAHGAASVRVVYSPTGYATVAARVRVAVSQFAFESYVAEVVASCRPEGDKGTALLTAAAERSASTLSARAESVGGSEPRGGAGGGIERKMFRDSKAKKDVLELFFFISCLYFVSFFIHLCVCIYIYICPR